jgi:hypothetical protein
MLLWYREVTMSQLPRIMGGKNTALAAAPILKIS